MLQKYLCWKMLFSRCKVICLFGTDMVEIFHRRSKNFDLLVALDEKLGNQKVSCLNSSWTERLTDILRAVLLSWKCMKLFVPPQLHFIIEINRDEEFWCPPWLLKACKDFIYGSGVQLLCTWCVLKLNCCLKCCMPNPWSALMHRPPLTLTSSSLRRASTADLSSATSCCSPISCTPPELTSALSLAMLASHLR